MTENQIAKVTPIEQACKVITSEAYRKNVAQALPPEISVDRFLRTALTALQLKPEIAEADRQSLYNSIVVAAQMRLMPDNREGALVVYKTKVGNNWEKRVQFQPMVAGIIKRFGEVGVLVYAASVYENELAEFRLWNDDTGQHVEHRPIVFGERGKFVGVFGVARTPDGRTYVETMGLEEIAKVKAASKSKDQQGNPVGPWKDWEDRMAQKSVLHRLGRRVPITDPRGADLADVVEADRELYGDDAPQAPTGQVVQEPAQTGPRRPRGLDVVAAAGERAGVDPDAIEGDFVEVRDDRPVDDQVADGNPAPDHF